MLTALLPFAGRDLNAILCLLGRDPTWIQVKMLASLANVFSLCIAVRATSAMTAGAWCLRSRLLVVSAVPQPFWRRHPETQLGLPI